MLGGISINDGQTSYDRDPPFGKDVIEGNSGPGIDWDVTKMVNEKKSKQLITYIVEEFATRIKST